MKVLKGRSWSSCKRSIQRSLRNLRIEVRKFPSVPFRAVSVFSLAVNLLMKKQGEAVTFVQIGANDGVFGDPLRRYITTYPWRGILVEPQPDVFDRLTDNYRLYRDRLILEQVAISRDQSEFVLYKAAAGLMLDEIYASSVASGCPNTVAKQLGISTNKLERLVVPSLTLDELLERHGFSNIQVLQIDVEGYDWQVLRTLDLQKTAPSIIQFESGHLSNVDCDCAVAHLTKHDYEIYWGGYQGDAVALKAGLLY